MCVRNVNTYGIDPVWAECTCRFATETGTHAEMAAAFDAHTVAAGAGLVVTPWRVVAVPA
jgi:hypothetical protein